MPSGKAVGVLVACAMALLLFTAVMRSAVPQEEVAHEAARAASNGGVPLLVVLPEDDVDKDFAAKFAIENEAELRRWTEGEDASDPLDGASPMSRADRKRANPNTKFDKFDEGMLEGTGQVGPAAESGLQADNVLQLLRDLRRTGDDIKTVDSQRDTFSSRKDSRVAEGEGRTLVPVDSERAKVKPSSEWATPASPTCYVPPGRDSCGPHFVVAGAMKCGTTSMYAYLLNHPQVLPLAPNAKLNNKAILAEKEVRFFNDPTYTQLATKYDVDGALAQYYDLFQEIPPPSSPSFSGHPHANMVTGEASPMYICSRYAGERARGAMPYGKVIIMLRNPVDRTYSEFWFRQSLSRRSQSKDAGAGVVVLDDVYDDAFLACTASEMEVARRCNHLDLIESPTIATVEEFSSCWNREMAAMRKDVKEGSDYCLARKGEPICNMQYRKFCTGNNIKNSLYAHQMVEWVQAFPDSQIMFIKSEDFYENTAEVMKRVEKFLGLSLSLNFDWHAVTGQAFNIVNPGTRSAEGKDIVAGSSGLRVGASDHEAVSEYPPMKPSTRQQMEQFFRPHNRALQAVLRDKSPVW